MYPYFVVGNSKIMSYKFYQFNFSILFYNDKLQKKKILEKCLEKRVLKAKQNVNRLTSRMQRIDDFIRNEESNDERLIDDIHLVKSGLIKSVESSPEARLLKFSKQNRYLLRSKKYNIMPKRIDGP